MTCFPSNTAELGNEKILSVFLFLSDLFLLVCDLLSTALRIPSVRTGTRIILETPLAKISA